MATESPSWTDNIYQWTSTLNNLVQIGQFHRNKNWNAQGEKKPLMHKFASAIKIFSSHCEKYVQTKKSTHRAAQNAKWNAEKYKVKIIKLQNCRFPNREKMAAFNSTLILYKTFN
jgi:hypothetical protein